MSQDNRTKYLDILQIFRGIAALMVVVHHSAISIRYYHHVNSVLLDFMGAIGKHGVDFFFILSGFIISYTYYFKSTNQGAFRQYIVARVLRIYIPYLPIGLLMYVLYYFFPAFSNSERNISLLTSVTLFPSGNPALSVAWTLSFEMIFYILFSLNFIKQIYWQYFIIIWATLIITYSYILPFKAPIRLLSVLVSPYNLEFILGYLLSVVVLKADKINKLTLIIASFTFFSAFLVLQYYKPDIFYFAPNLLFSLATFVFFAYAIKFLNRKINANNLFLHIGNATYSIYLIHDPLQTLLVRILPKKMLWPVTLLVVTVLCVVVSYLYYLIFERYFLSKAKKIAKIAA